MNKYLAGIVLMFLLFSCSKGPKTKPDNNKPVTPKTFTVSTLVGSTNPYKFNWPSGIIFAANGYLYVTDTFDQTIMQVTSDGTVYQLSGSYHGPGSNDGGSARYTEPTGIYLDKATGAFYISDSENEKIRKIRADGVVTTYAGTGYFGADNGPTHSATFFSPQGLIMDASGNLYICDQRNGLIRKISSDGTTVSTFAGNGTLGLMDGAGSAAEFHDPWGIAIDKAGNLYVADALNNAIRKITPGGVVSTLAGNGTTGTTDGTGAAAKFNHPAGIAINSDGDLYVTDEFNNSIRKITAAGVVTTVAGKGAAGLKDGVGLDAEFNNPIGITIDSDGNLYVVDSMNNAIRKITIK